MSSDISSPRPRLVAIVGRPNVGKSSLFNRIADRRIAIVHPVSGVTRDRLVAHATWRGVRFDLVDTGGVGVLEGTHIRDDVEAAVKRQAERALAEAAVAILVVDVEAGIHPLDEEVARLIRRGAARPLVAANKADTPARDNAALEFARLGLPVFAVSAAHGRGVDALMAAVVRALPEEAPGDGVEPVKVAIVGRPNVGKSSYINQLLSDERVIVSATPGTTRDSVDVPFTVGEGEAARHYLLIDTAGLRQERKIDSSVEKFSQMRAEGSIRRADVVGLMIDGTQEPTAQDKRIATLILENNKGCVILANKRDLVRGSEPELRQHFQSHIPFMRYCPMLFISARTGHNVRSSLEAIERVAQNVRATLATGPLNRVLTDACQRVSPPTRNGKALKIYYGVQVGTSPLAIRLYVNDPRRVTPAYREYLARALREAFHLEGAPIVVQLHARARGERPAGAEKSGAREAETAQETGHFEPEAEKR